MKNIFISLLTTLALTSAVFGQDRTEKAKALIATDVISQLNEATGWTLNKDKEWVSLKNTIPESLKSEYTILLEHESHGEGIDNFKYYQLKELTYKDSLYYILCNRYVFC